MSESRRKGMVSSYLTSKGFFLLLLATLSSQVGAMEWESVASIPDPNWDISDRVFLRNQEELYVISDEVVSVYQIPSGRLLRRFPVPDWIEVVDDQRNPIPDSPLGNHNFSPEIRFFDKKEGTLYISGYRIVDGSYREYRTRPWYKPKADKILHNPIFFTWSNGQVISQNNYLDTERVIRPINDSDSFTIYPDSGNISFREVVVSLENRNDFPLYQVQGEDASVAPAAIAIQLNSKYNLVSYGNFLMSWLTLRSLNIWSTSKNTRYTKNKPEARYSCWLNKIVFQTFPMELNLNLIQGEHQHHRGELRQIENTKITDDTSTISLVVPFSATSLGNKVWLFDLALAKDRVEYVDTPIGREQVIRDPRVYSNVALPIFGQISNSPFDFSPRGNLFAFPEKDPATGLFKHWSVYRIILNGTINNNSVRVRSAPNTTGSVLTRLNRGARVKVLDRTDEEETIGGQTNYWYQIRLSDRREGWVFGAFLDVSRE